MQKIQEENLEEMYKTACSIFKQASTIKEFSNESGKVKLPFSNLDTFKYFIDTNPADKVKELFKDILKFNWKHITFDVNEILDRKEKIRWLK